MHLTQCENTVGRIQMRKIRTYSNLSRFDTFRERYEYLRIGGSGGEQTFGFDRYLNQLFYKSKEWLSVRDFVIVRDHGCDLGILDHEIREERILIHHMNPISIEDILKRTEILLNPEYLITTILSTHNAIHYGDENLLICDPVVRFENDTCPWKG